MRRIRIAVGLAVAVLVVLLAACSSQPDPCVLLTGGKFQPASCGSTSTADPKFAVIGISILCSTVVVLVLIAFVHSLATSWRHAEDEEDRQMRAPR